MKKILINAYLNLNFGDDLFLKILFDRYKEKDVRWILPKAYREYKSVFSKEKNVIIGDIISFKLKRKLNIIEKNSMLTPYDAGIYIGGSIFIQLKEWEKQYNERSIIINSFAKKNKPYFILGANFGPYTNLEFLRKYKEIFKHCEDICFRDTYSYNLFNDLNNVRLSPDIVLQLKTKEMIKVKNSIGISLINLSNREKLNKYNEDYFKIIKNLIEFLIDNGKNITLFSFCEAEGDMIIINKLINSFELKYLENISVESYTGDIEGFLEKFSKMENIIGTRFHACILSQVFNQGLFPIIYSKKTYDTLRDMNLGEHYINIEQIKKLDFNKLLSEIANNKLKDKEIFKKSENQFNSLDKFMNQLI